MLDKHILKHIGVKPGEKIRLKDFPTDWVPGEEFRQKDHGLKDAAKKSLKKHIEALSDAQERLYAGGSHGLLIILQGMDAAGKDGTVKHVMTGINPQGCSVYSFKQPSSEETSHNFLWRYSKVVPERGRISIFNRSYYEEVITVKIHPEWLKKQHIDHGRHESLWKERYEDINAFEKHLLRSGIVVLKFFLHIGKDEQRERILERLNDPAKQWKYAPGDLIDRTHWDAYQKAYEKALTATNTNWAPWYIIPADFKWSARSLISELIATSLHDLKIRLPVISQDVKAQIEVAKAALKQH